MNSTRLSERGRSGPRQLPRFDARLRGRSPRSVVVNPSLRGGPDGGPMEPGQFQSCSQIGNRSLLHHWISVRDGGRYDPSATPATTLDGSGCPRSLDQAQELDRSLCTTRHSQLPRPMKMTVGAVVTMTHEKPLDSIKRERKHR
jgi:hypothetical protein